MSPQVTSIRESLMTGDAFIVCDLSMSYFMGLQVISQIKSFLTNNTFVSFGTYRLIYS